MRWTTAVPTTWPDDATRARAWQLLIRPVLTSSVGADERVTLGADATGEPTANQETILLVSGDHLQPGAAYRVAPQLTRGVLTGRIAPCRAAVLEWAPSDEPGRAHVEVHGLDGLVEACTESTLAYLSGRARLDPTGPAAGPEALLQAEVGLRWLRATLAVRVRDGALHLDLALRGRGAWRAAVAALLGAGRSTVQQSLDETAHDLARWLTELPHQVAHDRLASPPEVVAADGAARHARLIDAAMAEAARRQHAVADAVARLPWWRRTASRWRRELAALGPGLWPGDEVPGLGGGWAEGEQVLTTRILARRGAARIAGVDAEVAARRQTLLAAAHARDTNGPVGPVSPVGPLTDAATDLSWLGSPWSLVRGAPVSRR